MQQLIRNEELITWLTERVFNWTSVLHTQRLQRTLSKNITHQYKHQYSYNTENKCNKMRFNKTSQNPIMCLQNVLSFFKS